MKLLYVSSWPPFPLNSGGRLRSFEVLRFLKSRYQVQLLTFVAGPRERAAALEQGAIPLDYNTTGPGRSLLPASLRPFDNPQLYEALRSFAGQGFQATVFDQIFVSHAWESACGLPVLLEQNIESEILRQRASLASRHERPSFMAQALALRGYEQEMWPKFPLRACVSQHDVDLMQGRCPQGTTLLLPNGVSLERYAYMEPGQEPRVLFVGALDYFPNQDAVDYLCEQVMPLVWQQEPDLRLRVVGRNPPESLCHRVAQDARCELYANAADLTPLARDCFMSVVPLRIGSGTRLKILEAAAWGLAVVSTGLGCQGLELEPGKHLWVADQAAELAEAIVTLWNRPRQRLKLAEACRQVVEAKYSWDFVLAPLQQALDRQLCA